MSPKKRKETTLLTTATFYRKLESISLKLQNETNKRDLDVRREQTVADPNVGLTASLLNKLNQSCPY